MKLRDRDAIITKEGIIFRVYGYFHPPEGYICDVEYAPADIYRSEDPRAPRKHRSKFFYKFYADGGLKFVLKNFPEYTLFYKPLGEKLVGVRRELIAEVRRPEEKLQKILAKEPLDKLLLSLQDLMSLVTSISGLSTRNFGVFGSLLHDFYHPEHSDLDLIVYGRKNLEKLRETLKDVYEEADFSLKNEFEDEKVLEGKRWRFKNYSVKEFLWHQRRKLIYGIFDSEVAGRKVKVEFEPVKEWDEIYNEYEETRRIVHEGWVRAVARVLDDKENAFMPSIYPIEILEILEGPKADDIRRIISYVEEFRMQAWKDEIVYVEGNLERVEMKNKVFHQITLTYGPHYYEQTLKVLELNSL
ncbi:hypothetical protein DRO54_01315 [Candidatus Bathyarchaeota archaeon]|nr:MAG: hypothetical protein DRO54_01315 [Candidatus Bathyarchaeota archaeon]